jgi:hypothetical protein
MSNKKSKDKFFKLEEFIRSLAAGVEPEVKGVPEFRPMRRRLGTSEKWFSKIETMALDEVLNEFCPNYISKNGNSRAVVDEWIHKCVLEVLERKPAINLETEASFGFDKKSVGSTV